MTGKPKVQVAEKKDTFHEDQVDDSTSDEKVEAFEQPTKKRKLNFFNVLIRGAAVQSFIIIFLRPLIVLAPSLLSSFLVIIVSNS